MNKSSDLRSKLYLKKDDNLNKNSKKNRVTFNLIDQLKEESENSDYNEYQEININIRTDKDIDDIYTSFKPKSEQYAPIVEYKSGIFLDYYTCKEFNKKVCYLYFFLFDFKIIQYFFFLNI